MNDMMTKHIKAIINSPVFAPWVRGYFYQVAKVADMQLRRAMSANPVPSFPSSDMIASQANYSIMLGKNIQIEEDSTQELIQWACEYNSTRSGADGVDGVAVAICQYVVG